MINGLRKSVAAAFAAVLIGGLTPSAAVAAVDRHKDATGDAVLEALVNCDEPRDSCETVVRIAPEHKMGDIQASRVNYRRSSLTLAVRVRNAQVTSGRTTFVNWMVRTANGKRLDASIRDDGQALDEFAFVRGGRWCDGATARLNRAKAVYRMVIPASCLNRTRWVQVAATTEVRNDWALKRWADDARQVAGDLRPPFQTGKFGPRVRRG